MNELDLTRTRQTKFPFTLQCKNPQIITCLWSKTYLNFLCFWLRKQR